MTTTLNLTLAYLDRDSPMIVVDYGAGTTRSIAGTARQQVERVTTMVREYSTMAYVYDESDWDEPVAAVIPAGLAAELVKEGRIKWPLYTSMTVPA